MNEQFRVDEPVVAADRLASGVTTGPIPRLYSRSEGGHRASYIEFLGRLLGGQRVGAKALLGSTDPVLFLMIEDSFALYALVASFRALLGRRTVGLLFRPRPALEGKSARLCVKRLALRFLRQLEQCRTLTILPFSIEPDFAEIADGWIDDPQLWDLSEADRAAATRLRERPEGLAATIRAEANGRRVVVAVGRQDEDKGFDQFARLYAQDVDLRQQFLFASAGKLGDGVRQAGAELDAAGGHVTDRRIEDFELLELYAAADLVWCCYSEGYDQASGIMGRAAQLGIPVVVRKGSLLERQCVVEGILHIALQAGVAGTLADAQTMQPMLGENLSTKFGARSLLSLRQALGLEGAGAP